MRVFNQWAAAVAAIGAAATGVSAAMSERQTDKAQARDLKHAALAEEVAGQRAIRDEKETQALRISRILAYAGATGRGADLYGYAGRDAAESALRVQRIGSDTAYRAAALRTQATNIRKVAELNMYRTLIAGMGSSARQVSSIYGGRTDRGAGTSPAGGTDMKVASSGGGSSVSGTPISGYTFFAGQPTAKGK